MRYYAFIMVFLTLASGAAAAERHFQSPSGNIRCVLSEEGVLAARCDLGVDRQTYTDRPASCDGEWGASFGLGRTGPGFLICVSGPIDGPENPVVLPYGTSAVFADVSCRSETTGMTCRNMNGGGFSVRRAEQRIF